MGKWVWEKQRERRFYIEFIWNDIIQIFQLYIDAIIMNFVNYTIWYIIQCDTRINYNKKMYLFILVTFYKTPAIYNKTAQKLFSVKD